MFFRNSLYIGIKMKKILQHGDFSQCNVGVEKPDSTNFRNFEEL